MQRERFAEIKLKRVFHNKPVAETDRYHPSNDEQKRFLFNRWAFADSMVKRLENIRAANEPKTPDDWNEEFCMAVQALPEAQQFERECWWDYYSYRGKRG